MAAKIIIWGDRLLRRAMLLLVDGYRLLLAPWLGGGCRFTPTCSAYARLVLANCSAPRALWLIVGRLLRCHPFARGGEDWPPKN